MRIKFTPILKKLSIIFSASLFCLVISCHFKTDPSNISTSKVSLNQGYKKLNSLKKRDSLDSIRALALSDRPDSEQETPSGMQEIKKIEKSYNLYKEYDTTLLKEKDSLHLIIKYYCLKNISVSIPKDLNYSNSGFQTHPFASSIILINRKDTVLNKEFKANYFTAIIGDNFGGNLSKYGSIIAIPSISKKSKNDLDIVLSFSIAIPATDIGYQAFMKISKNGKFKVLKEYD